MEKDLYSFARKSGLSERKIIDVSSGICPCGPSKKVKAAIRKAIRDVRLTPDPSLMRLRKTVSSRLGVDGDSLLFGNTVEELLCLISDVFNPRKVLAAGPLLDVHSAVLSSSGAELEYLDEGERGILVEGKTWAPGDGLVFMSQPNRITGRLADSRRLDEILDFCATQNDLAVVDESLIEFTGEHGSSERAAREGAMIVLRSTANFYGLPGLGLAYAVSSPEMTERLRDKRRCEVSALAAAAARAAVKDGTYARAARKYVGAERTLLVKSLKKIDGVTPYDSDSNVMLIKVAYPPEKISAALSEQGFLISTWNRGDAQSETFFRLSVMDHEKNVKFLRILKQAARVERATGGSGGD